MPNIATLPYDSEWIALSWAKKYCPSYITNTVHKVSFNDYDIYRVDYYFADEKELMFFKLRWE